MDWNAIKTEYVTTSASYRKLSEKYGISLTQIFNHSKAEGWQNQREQYLKRTYTKKIENAEKREIERYKRIQTVADKLLDKVEKAIDSLSGEEIIVDKQLLKGLSGTLKDIKEIQSAKSDLDRKEQLARIKNLEKQTEEELDKKVTVKILGGDDSWRN